MSRPVPNRISIKALVDELELAAGRDYSGVPIHVLVVEGLERAVECGLAEHFGEDDVLELAVRPRLADEVRAYVRGLSDD